MIEPYQFKAKVVRVVDGDTVIMLVDQGLRLFQELSLRMEGINAPERNAAGGTAATEHLRSLLPVGKQCVIETHKNPTDKYGRWLATIYVEGQNVNLVMVEDGHAVPYLIA